MNLELKAIQVLDENRVQLSCFLDKKEKHYCFQFSTVEDARSIEKYDQVFDDDIKNDEVAKLLKLAIQNLDESRQAPIEVQVDSPLSLQVTSLVCGLNNSKADVFSVGFNNDGSPLEFKFQIEELPGCKQVSWQFGTYRATKSKGSYWKIENASWTLHSLCAALLRVQEANNIS